MYDIYIQNYLNANGVLQTSEALLYSIPIAAANKDKILIDPTVKCEMGKAGTFEFTIQPNNPYYNCWQQMKTLMRVVYDGDTIFRGRVLTIDNTLFGAKKIHLEGDLAFLIDSQQPASKEEKRATISIYAYLQQIISNHNSQVHEDGTTYKQFSLGEVPGNYSSATDDQQVHPDASFKYGSSSWETSMQALESLQKDYGGYFRTRYVNGVVYLDWLDSYFDAPSINPKQIIQIGENLIDLNSSAEVDNIFTALIPIGVKQGEEVNISGYRTDVHGANNKRILVPQIVGLYTDEQLNTGYHSKADYQNAINRYGVIVKTQKFENADTQQKLWDYAIDFIKNNYVGGLTHFSLSAVDMHHLDGSVVKYLCGERIPIMYPDLDSRANGVTPTISKTLTALSITYKLHNPEKNSYELGIPNNIIQKKYGSTKSKKGGSGYSKKQDDEDEDLRKALEKDKDGVDELAWQYVINEKYNNAEYQQLLANDPNLQYAPTVLKTTKTIIKGVLQNDPRQKQTFQTIILDGNTGEVGFMQNPALGEMARSVKSLLINGFTAKLTAKELIEAGQTTQPKTLMEMYSDPDKFFKFQTWKKNHAKEDPQATIAAMISGEDGTIASIINKLGLDGSGLKSTIIQDGLTSMLKFFNPSTVTTQNPTETVQFDGATGKGKVGKDINGNWEIKFNDTVTYTDENGVTQTKPGFISAKDFNLPEVASFKTQTALFGTAIMLRAYVEDLEAVEERVQTLEADSITTNNLSAKISALNVVNANSVSVTNGVNANWLMAPYIYMGSLGHATTIDNIFLDGIRLDGPDANNNYSLYKSIAGTETLVGTFNRAGGVLTGAWSGGVYSVKDGNNTERLSTKIWALLPDTNSEITVTGKVVSRDFRAMYGADEDHLYSIGVSYPVSIDASDVYDDGKAAMGVTVDTANHKIKAAVTATKEIAITAGAGNVTWNSTTNRFECTGYAYAGGTQIAESASKGQSNVVSIDVGSVSGTGSSGKRVVKVNNGSGNEILNSGDITDYGDGYTAGYDADHNPRISYGSGGSCNGDFEMAKAVKAFCNKTGNQTQESTNYWYVPGCHLVVLSSTPSSYISNLGFGSYIEVIGVNHDGSQQHFGKIWRIPPASEAYPNTIALKQQAGYAGASKMVMYYKDNNGDYHAAGGGASLAWYMSATSMGNTGSYKTLRYD